jgi:GWxTD domain-containing protein
MAIGDSSSCRRAPRAASWILPALLTVMLFARHDLLYPQAPDLAPFQDSVRGIHDVDRLRGMIKDREGGKSPSALAERGFLALRLYDLTTQTSHSKLAQESFKQAIKQQPEYGWAHYGLGLAYANSPDAHPEKLGWRSAFVVDDVLASAMGNDVRSRAHREFVKAVGGVPPVARAAEELVENALVKNKRKTIEEARNALLRHLDATPQDGEAWFALARAAGELGDMPVAADAIEQADRYGMDLSAVARERASLLLRMPGKMEAGAKAWFAGLDRMTLAQSEEYFQDVEALLSKKEIDAWKEMDLDARANFLRTFWDMRAALGGVSVAERLAEHYGRLTFARQRFYRESKFGAPAGNELRMQMFSQRSDYDDRGLIYIRHGAPAGSVARRGMERYESWVYNGLDGEKRAFHFFEVSVTKGFSLMHKLPCDTDFLEERAEMDARFYRLASRCSTMDMLALSADHRQVAFEALATDTDRPAFVRELPFFFDLYTFRGDAGRTSVVAAVAVPFERLTRKANDYRLDVSLILADTASKRVIRPDDSLSLGARNIKPDDLFRLHVEIAAPPSNSTVQRVIVSDPSEPGIGQLYGGPFRIPDYSGTKLMLSDLVLAEPTPDGRWRRGEVALALVPTGYFRGGSFNVFYEIYNIAPSAKFITEIEIEPIRESAGDKLKGLFGGKGKMTLRFESEATAARNGVLQELRRVDAPLPAGKYRMRVIVTNLETRESAKTERTFAVPKD